MKKLAAILACLLAIGSTPSETKNEPMDYYAYTDTLDQIEIIDSPDLSYREISTRNGKLIIERCIGVVVDEKTGEGHVIDCPDLYVSYRCVPDIHNGDIICTYFVYNPDTNYVDDIISRFDYIVDGEGL